jgi:archaellum component FlaC
MAKDKKHSSGSALIPIALLTALVGGVGAALMASPKQSKMKKNLQEIGDEVVDVFDNILAKVESQARVNPSKELSDASKTVMAFFDELKNLNDSVDNVPAKNQTFVSKVADVVKKEADVVKQEVRVVEQKVEEVIEENRMRVSEDITDKIAWLQKKGRNLAKRRF